MDIWSSSGLKAGSKEWWKGISKSDIEKKLVTLPSYVKCMRCGANFKLKPEEKPQEICPNCGAKE